MDAWRFGVLRLYVTSVGIGWDELVTHGPSSLKPKASDDAQLLGVYRNAMRGHSRRINCFRCMQGACLLSPAVYADEALLRLHHPE